MNQLSYRILVLLAVGSLSATRPSPDPLVFVASTPCDLFPRTQLAISPQTPCEFITWNLTLHRDPRTQAPTKYHLVYTYGMTQPGTQGFKDGGTTATRDGVWRQDDRPGNRVIYRLDPSTPTTTLSFLRLDDRLLHLLDSQGKLMIGHAGWSYAMNRN
jgi:hypothetical protein